MSDSKNSAIKMGGVDDASNHTFAEDFIEHLKDLRNRWSSGLVARSHVEKFSGGLLHPRTMANLDCRGEGPPRIKIGRRVAYPVDGLITWMAERGRVQARR